MLDTIYLVGINLSMVNFPSLWAARNDEVNLNARNETGPKADRETSTISPPP